MADRNFDDLAERFRKRIYGGLKGDIRLAVLNRDLQPVLDTGTRLRVLDAGGGQGQFALDLAEAGHQVTIADISARMLAQARELAAERHLQERVAFVQGPLQALGREEKHQGNDLVLCHAVLEWLEKPHEAVQQLVQMLRPGGHLSLTFYNRRALEFRLLQRGSFRQLDRNIDSGYWGGHPGSLTPDNPLCPEWVQDWVLQAGLTVTAHSGIRCFNDFMTPSIRDKLPASAVVGKELEFSRRDPYRQLARYVHLLCRRPL
ncbi:methyltransferase domain-containing protein [Microbulbifer sp. M83]|uniref:methyltransferase domain-containing protein n=1 Tax=unclassified Microbulbifer TaxID=2619833 RepID=UPI002FDF6C50